VTFDPLSVLLGVGFALSWLPLLRQHMRERVWVMRVNSMAPSAGTPLTSDGQARGRPHAVARRILAG